MGAECQPYGRDPAWATSFAGYNAGEPINLYIENTFGAELRNCMLVETNENSDLDLMSSADAQTLTRNTIIAAAEAWNTQSRGAPIIYRGVLPLDEVENNCSSFFYKPAIFVRFDPNCRLDEDGLCITDSAASALPTFCDGVLEVVLWGDGNEPPSTSATCVNEPMNDQINNWRLLSTNGRYDLKGTMVHEFGHALSLGHPRGRDNVFGDPENLLPDAFSTETSDLSVMDIGTDTPLGIYRRFLYPYERDCVDDGDNRAERTLQHKYVTFTPGGALVSSSPSTLSNTTAKGFTTGGGVRHSVTSTSHYYLAYFDAFTRKSFAGIDGNLYFGSPQNFASNTPYSDLHIAPTFMTAYELATTGNTDAHRLNYNRHMQVKPSPYVTSGYNFHDPPRLNFVRSNTYFSSSSPTGGYFSDGPALQSHIPLASAWSEPAGETVFVSVNTSRDINDMGDIRLYPGLVNGTNNVLNTQSVLSDNLFAIDTPNDGVTGMGYRRQTEVGVGVACADVASPFSHGFNCVLFWVDRGVPDQRILYTFFRIGTTGQIEYWQNPLGPNAFILGGSHRAFGHVSAAWFAGRFWLAWKGEFGTIHYRSILGNGNAFNTANWSSTTTLFRNNVVDAPTWQYTPNQSRETALFWTEAQ